MFVNTHTHTHTHTHIGDYGKKNKRTRKAVGESSGAAGQPETSFVQ